MKYENVDILKVAKMEEKWIEYFPEILCSLELSFPLQTSVEKYYLIPCMMPNILLEQIIPVWKKEAQFFFGRRLEIENPCEMFHPAFLPQVICHLLSSLSFLENPIIWQVNFIY